MKRLIALTLLVTLPAMAMAGFQRIWENPDYVEKAFAEIAFKHEYEAGLKRLSKWMQPIRYRIQYDGIKPLAVLSDDIHNHFRTLHRLTGIDIRPAQHSANFTIILTRDRNYAARISEVTGDSHQAVRLSQESNCITYLITREPHNAIQRAWVIIPADHAFKKGLYHSCVVEELTQALGLPNDADWVSPSVANDLDIQEELSPLDRLMVRLLYRPELKSGMTLREAYPIIHRLVPEMIRQRLWQ